MRINYAVVIMIVHHFTEASRQDLQKALGVFEAYRLGPYVLIFK